MLAGVVLLFCVEVTDFTLSLKLSASCIRELDLCSLLFHPDFISAAFALLLLQRPPLPLMMIFLRDTVHPEQPLLWPLN